jgi:phosphoribosylanthranilate isomerase
VTVTVKICGVTRAEDADLAVRAGADWLGLNLWPRSRRWVDARAAGRVAEAARAARADVTLVGVFVNQAPEEIEALVEAVGLDLVQLHGTESPEICARFGERAIKAMAIRGMEDVRLLDDYPDVPFVLDTPSPDFGGSGRTFDWTLAKAAVGSGHRILLAGGLTPANVALAVREVAPFGVDVASGVESSAGVKDPDKVRRFIAAAKGHR